MLAAEPVEILASLESTDRLRLRRVKTGGHVTRSTHLYRLVLLIVVLGAIAAAVAGWGWDDSMDRGGDVPAAVG